MQPTAAHQGSPSPELDRFRERIRTEWTDAEVVTAWQQWHSKMSASSRPLTEALLEAADLRPGMRVLDLACGTGEPALSIAQRVGKAGHVVATDLSPGMVAAARANATRNGFPNMSFQEADAERLPFEDQSFDRVVSRLGVMFWTDALQGQREVLRVLRPGGRVAYVAWGARERVEMFSLTVGILARHVEIPPPEPGAPTPFRFAEPGSLSAVMRTAGFRDVREEHREVTMPWPGTPEEVWRWFLEIAAPFRPLLEGLAPEVRARVDADVLEAMRSRRVGGEVRLRAEIVVAAGER